MSSSSSSSTTVSALADTTIATIDNGVGPFGRTTPASSLGRISKKAKKGKSRKVTLQEAKDGDYYLNKNKGKLGCGKKATTHEDRLYQNYTGWQKVAGKPIHPDCDFAWYRGKTRICNGCGDMCPERVGGETSRSLDCIDPSICYSPPNVQTLCMFCNFLFGSYQKPTAVAQMKKIINYRATKTGAF